MTNVKERMSLLIQKMLLTHNTKMIFNNSHSAAISYEVWVQK